jgi:hypothetical protein
MKLSETYHLPIDFAREVNQEEARWEAYHFPVDFVREVNREEARWEAFRQETLRSRTGGIGTGHIDISSAQEKLSQAKNTPSGRGP